MDARERLEDISPTPWREGEHLDGGHIVIVDANGNEVCVFWKAEDAAFIMEAPTLLRMLHDDNQRLRRQVRANRGHFNRELNGRPHP